MAMCVAPHPVAVSPWLTSLSGSFQLNPLPQDCSPCHHHLWRTSAQMTQMTLSFRHFCPGRKAPPRSRTPASASR